MNALEDRVRAAARAAAATVADGSAPPLRLPQERRRPGGRPRWFAPLAAAAAVLALIAASIFAAHAVIPGTRSPALSASLPRLRDGLPAYFIEYSISDRIPGPEPRTKKEASPPIPQRLRSHETLQVVATATGNVAATATLPGYVTAIAASRGAFFAAVVRDSKVRFYEIRLNGSRTATTVTELPIRPDTAPLAYIAVSPDGARLAYSIAGASGSVQDLVVASTARGSQREWVAPVQDSEGYIGPMNWLGDGKTLAFNWTTFGSGGASSVSLRLLDTAAPGSDLMAGRAVLPSVFKAGAFDEVTMLSLNGQAVVGVASGSRVSRSPAGSEVAFSAATGEPTVLYRASPPSSGRPTGCYSPPLWMNSAGSEVLTECFQQIGSVITVNVLLMDHGHVTMLPWLGGAAGEVTAFP